MGEKKITAEDKLRRRQFGAWIQHQRNKKGITQTELSVQLGAGSQIISSYETGQRAIARKHIPDLIDILDVDPRQFALRYLKAEFYLIYELLFGDRMQHQLKGEKGPK